MSNGREFQRTDAATGNEMLHATRVRKQTLSQLHLFSIVVKTGNELQVYLNSESDVAKLCQTIDLVKSQPIVVVAFRRPKPVTILQPVLGERHQTSSDLPLHQDPTVDGQQRHSDSRVGAQSRRRRRHVGRLEICNIVLMRWFGRCSCKVKLLVCPKLVDCF